MHTVWPGHEHRRDRVVRRLRRFVRIGRVGQAGLRRRIETQSIGREPGLPLPLADDRVGFAVGVGAPECPGATRAKGNQQDESRKAHVSPGRTPDHPPMVSCRQPDNSWTHPSQVWTELRYARPGLPDSCIPGHRANVCYLSRTLHSVSSRPPHVRLRIRRRRMRQPRDDFAPGPSHRRRPEPPEHRSGSPHRARTRLGSRLRGERRRGRRDTSRPAGCRRPDRPGRPLVEGIELSDVLPIGSRTCRSC